MIRLRQFTCAFLENEDDILLIHRSASRNIAPGLWAGVGGHLEPSEISTPYHAVIREIEEETGLTERYIDRLRLQFMTIRRADSEIRLQYIYTGGARSRELTNTTER